jgi:hypothetical protein
MNLTPMRGEIFPLALMSSRLVLMLIEIALLLTLRVIVFHMRVLGAIFSIVLLVPSERCVSEEWDYWPRAGAENRK